jgi:integrase
MSSIVRKAEGQDQVLYALLAGTGLRVGEAFGLEIRHLSADCRTITVEQLCWEGDIQTPKTRNAYRKVDLCAVVPLSREQKLSKCHMIVYMFRGKSLFRMPSTRS